MSASRSMSGLHAHVSRPVASSTTSGLAPASRATSEVAAASASAERRENTSHVERNDATKPGVLRASLCAAAASRASANAWKAQPQGVGRPPRRTQPKGPPCAEPTGAACCFTGVQPAEVPQPAHPPPRWRVRLAFVPPSWPHVAQPVHSVSASSASSSRLGASSLDRTRAAMSASVSSPAAADGCGARAARTTHSALATPTPLAPAPS